MERIRRTNDTSLLGSMSALVVCALGCASESGESTTGMRSEPPVVTANATAGTGASPSPVGVPTGSPSGAQAGRGAITPSPTPSSNAPTGTGTQARPGAAGMMAAAAAAGRGAAPPPPAATPAGSAAPAGPPPAPRGTTTCLNPGNGNYLNPGPYKVAKKNIDLGMIEPTQQSGKFTIYYPDPLEANCLHPIVGWGNGTGVTDSDFVYDFLHSAAASWGIVVASSAETNSGSGKFHMAGLDYLIKENATAGSIFHGKLSTRAGVSGHSQGGFGANRAAGHPNVVAAVVEGASFVSTAKVAGLTLTGTADLGVGAADAVSRAQSPMFVAVWEGGDHFNTETVLGVLSGDKGTVQFQRLYSAWFRCFLGDDDKACALFEGGAPDNCGICKDPGWARLASAKM